VLQKGQILAIPTKYLTIQQEHVGSEKSFFLREQIKLKIQLGING